jgi:hypothetical protein
LTAKPEVRQKVGVKKQVRIRFNDRETHVDMLVGARSIKAARSEIDALRERSGQSADFMTSLDRFLPWAVMGHEIPVALLLRSTNRDLYAVVLVVLNRRRGFYVGLAKSGNLAGQGCVIAAPDAQMAAMETAARVLLTRPLAHTVVMSMLVPTETINKGVAGDAPGATETWAVPDRPASGLKGHWQFRVARMRLDLAGGLEATMQRFGYKMRRNLRYYRRRAESELGCALVPEMSAADRIAAIEALLDKGTYKTGAKRARLLEAALTRTPGHFAMGLRDGEGKWLSFVTGWRACDGTHVEWQLNYDKLESASISTVMRGYLIEHEAERGSPAIIFVGLTSPYWSRVCEPVVCADLLATRNGLLGQAARFWACRVVPMGRVAKLYGAQARSDPASSFAHSPPQANVSLISAGGGAE